MTIIDCYRPFIKQYDSHLTKEALYDQWRQIMADTPIIKSFCIQEYQDNGYSVDTIALEKVFNQTHDNIKYMTIAYSNLQGILKENASQIREIFDEDIDDITIILYHGLGNAAGSVEQYKGQPAIWLGIEKIAELRWHHKERLMGLVIHELAHIVHEIKYNKPLLKDLTGESYYIMRLYVEGYATYIETMFTPRDQEWMLRCENHAFILKSKYAQVLKAQPSSCKDFYGDWHEVEGISDTGYYLGLIFIQYLLNDHSLETIATLPYNAISSALYHFLNKHSQ